MTEEPITIHLNELAFETVEAFHDFIAEALGFPEYYGRNLDALSDCLGDICHPVEVIIARRFDDVENWFDRVSSIFIRTALENPNLHVTIEG